jgi:hypothetical protein
MTMAVLTLSAFSNVTQIGLFLVLYCPRKKASKAIVAHRAIFQPNFANVNASFVNDSNMCSVCVHTTFSKKFDIK